MEYQIEDAERSGGSRKWRGFVNGQTTKRDSIVLVEGVAAFLIVTSVKI
jgi:hypothetical protein